MRLIKISINGVYRWLNTDHIRTVELDNDGDFVLRVSPMEVYFAEDTDENRAILGLPLKHPSTSNVFVKEFAEALGAKTDEPPIKTEPIKEYEAKKVKKKSPHSK